jgi:hypothetical protein
VDPLSKEYAMARYQRISKVQSPAAWKTTAKLQKGIA